MKKCLLSGLIIMLLISLGGVVSCGPSTVTFPDPNLEAAIREAIDKPEGTILPSDLEGLTYFDASLKEITDLSRLEYCTNLTELYLAFNQISDISALYSLTNLSLLDLGGNQISDISTLSNLTNLTVLELSGNKISDISALSNLTNLAVLFLSTNQISDISPLVDNSGLSSGHFVYLIDNPLSTRSLDVYIPQLQERGVDVSW